MATIIHKNELVRRALVYLGERARECPSASLDRLLDETGMRFNLSPKDAMDLEYIFMESRDSGHKKDDGQNSG